LLLMGSTPGLLVFLTVLIVLGVSNTELIFNRGLPSTNLNDDNPNERVNWAYDSPEDDGMLGDSFWLPDDYDQWIITGLRVWVVVNTNPQTVSEFEQVYNNITLYLGNVTHLHPYKTSTDISDLSPTIVTYPGTTKSYHYPNTGDDAKLFQLTVDISNVTATPGFHFFAVHGEGAHFFLHTTTNTSNATHFVDTDGYTAEYVVDTGELRGVLNTNFSDANVQIFGTGINFPTMAPTLTPSEPPTLKPTDAPTLEPTQAPPVVITGVFIVNTTSVFYGNTSLVDATIKFKNDATVLIIQGCIDISGNLSIEVDVIREERIEILRQNLECEGDITSNVSLSLKENDPCKSVSTSSLSEEQSSVYLLMSVSDECGSSPPLAIILGTVAGVIVLVLLLTFIIANIISKVRHNAYIWQNHQDTQAVPIRMDSTPDKTLELV